ncbi:hypothetical protein [Sphingobium yanoikuyae]|jgi:ABC-type cobalt transport system substrate-binding protein|uniref:Uncharacterized protein n=1 Tax=Sphingobium yanoikuyae TaxID=13690 RepID=A0A085K8N6_SPHYA|nr:hypothetical protein [Sphingobium yanoikuyae]AYO79719.1 hypothetical protein EBF16_24340 [Sphingobium yanoikuyae]KEZ19623.1 hypothetical protein CP98_01728 [Sphingobium yanoikuyae]KFD29082.1 hypothetical protein IH86_05535 [Sphingobium yanoikuyae]KZC83188.1 hypothetical protein AYR46_00990 [Sphingobium yanoikuyae]MDV3477679.1 hypothetical protein [Sphingobium yanoikuyae]
MFGVRLRSLFTSRWMALLWAILVLLSAIQFVGSDGGDQTGADQAATAALDGLDNSQRTAIANAL